ncbi:hypothetical protein RBU49_16095 [Clostridium sp. MB40-C1]|uniref:hypothetical protein n=1 Tax=Clostridium sp. MB40-C1 TaxID=3070996 RepID=UPI0027E030B1|nr:hypothetical protein [Clostridium sp. MB40-C1]WMJ80305.1 hypothetical protein RBU49_16095 [Clostridium sp. MB40-C1]
MKIFFENLLKILLKIVLLILVTMLICFIISFFKHFNFNNTLMFTGLGYMLIGVLSSLGSSTSLGNFKYIQSRRSTNKSSFEDTKEDFRLKDSSLNFMAFMSISGFIIIMLSYSITI